MGVVGGRKADNVPVTEMWGRGWFGVGNRYYRKLKVKKLPPVHRGHGNLPAGWKHLSSTGPESRGWKRPGWPKHQGQRFEPEITGKAALPQMRQMDFNS
jgi:hypothetical protein